MNKIRIVFTDIDGTSFINETQTCPKSTLLAFNKLREENIKIFICTSRSYRETMQLPKEYLDLVDGIICSTGSMIFYNNKLIKQYDLKQEDVLEMINIFNDNDITYRYITSNNECYLNKKSKEAEDSFKYLYNFVPDIKEYQNEQLSNLLCFTYDNKTIKSELENKLKHSDILDLIKVLEITDKGVSKGSGILDVCNYLNIDIKDTVGFGDSLNDIDMFKVVKCSVAMGNGHELLKKQATYITDHINDDGFYNICIKKGWIK